MRLLISSLLLAGTALAPLPAAAQASDTAELQRQLAAMQAEIARLSAQVTELQARIETSEPAPAPATIVAQADTQAEPGKAPVSVEWKGAPEIKGEGGWSFKPRGRLQIDTANVDAPDSAAFGNSFGTATEFRRAYLGVEGSLPGNFGYRIEADFAESSVELTDVYLTYEPADGITLTLGHHKPFFGLEEGNSDLFTSMLERAAFTSAFGFERRVGFSGEYAGKTVTVQLGAFTDNAADLSSDNNNSYSLNGRVVFHPKLGSGVLHVGGSAQFRELNDSSESLRYRARPFTHTTDVRLVDTGQFLATGERNFGAELAYINGPFHATIEAQQVTALRPGLADPTFRGGYAEIGLLVTPGDKTAYKNGNYDRIRPANPVNEGGIGAIQLNARYDRIDLTDGEIVGGTQQAAGLSAIWIPTAYVRFLLNYGHLWIADAAIPAGTDADYQVDTIGLRAQFDF
jgi:phosphate-selective porin OprO and OprP